jgi:hypothetical protein
MANKKDCKEIIAGEPVIKPQKLAVLEVCCDCGLNHLTFYRIENIKGKRTVIQTSYRDTYETQKSRKAFSYSHKVAR